jgi:hypothetical protein
MIFPYFLGYSFGMGIAYQDGPGSRNRIGMAQDIIRRGYFFLQVDMG